MDCATVDSLLDQLLVDHSDKPGIVRAVFQIGEAHYRQARWDRRAGFVDESRAHYAKALHIWQKIINEEVPVRVADAEVAQDAYHFAGECHRKLGNYQEAAEYFEHITNYWPDYKYAWNAYGLAASCYERLDNIGVLTTEQALARSEQAYQTIVNEYPDCRDFKYALGKLGNNLLRQNNWLDAAKYLEMYLLKGEPSEEHKAQINYDLGNCYVHLDAKDTALACYEEFIRLVDPDDERIDTLKAEYPELK